MGKKNPSLHFVEAMNIELTYKCNLSCPHCLQHGLRQQGDLTWIDTDCATRCLKEAKELGFTRSGVNFTGGEPFLRDSNLPELLRASKLLGLGVRVNTNGWWGGKHGITIGSEYFPSSKKIVKWLKQQKVALLALSFDGRYGTYPTLLHSVLQVMKECEAQGLLYQLIHTLSSSTETNDLWERVGQEADMRFGYMIPVSMEMVDLGAASGLEKVCSDSQIYCEGKGFYRPQYLHVNPQGGVRSCMYASGASWLGNINNIPFSEIAYRFGCNPVVEYFSNGSASNHNLVERIYSEKVVPKHPCSLAVKIANSIELNQ